MKEATESQGGGKKSIKDNSEEGGKKKRLPRSEGLGNTGGGRDGSGDVTV